MEKDKKEVNLLLIHASRVLWEAVFDEDSLSFLDYYYQHKAMENEIDVDMSAA